MESRGRVAIPHLQAWRLSKLWSQGQLAREAGIGVATVIRAEQGEKVTALTAARLARALGAPLTKLLGEMPPDF